MSTISETTAAAPFHPIGLVVTDDLHRSRLTVFFRYLLVIPHLVVLFAWSILLLRFGQERPASRAHSGADHEHRKRDGCDVLDPAN